MNITNIVLSQVSILILVDVASLQVIMCRRRSRSRGLGIKPINICMNDEEKIENNCYKSCSSGYEQSKFTCLKKGCPENYTQIAANNCQKPKVEGPKFYTRKLNEILQKGRTWQRCENDNGVGNCLKRGPLIYTKCKKGSRPLGCCNCVVDCPEGYRDSSHNCIKIPINRTIVPRAQCDNMNELDRDGLCYRKCESNYVGVGDFCWSKCNKDLPQECESHCTKTGKLCANLKSLGIASYASGKENKRKARGRKGRGDDSQWKNEKIDITLDQTVNYSNASFCVTEENTTEDAIWTTPPWPSH